MISKVLFIEFNALWLSITNIRSNLYYLINARLFFDIYII
nr:MAG TPA: hypothetical protein [Caudoviricetes sp.]